MKKNPFKITDLLALTVFAAFAVCVLIVLLSGARVYKTLVQRGEESFRLRMATQYVATRVRQAEDVTVADFDGYEALHIREEIDGAVYVTRIYCCDGYLRELFCAQSAKLSPEDGEKIMEAESMSFSQNEDLLTVSVDDRKVILQLRGKAGDVP
jgi:hypothetical protein